jgi:hypothetical protein
MAGASASSVSFVDINAVLNGGSCGQEGCSIKVCSVQVKKCSFYTCSNAKKCKKVRSVDLTVADISAAKREAESKK